MSALQHILSAFAIVERILRARTAYFAEIGQSQGLSDKILHLLILIALGFGVFGAVAGLSGHTLGPSLWGIVKLPALFLISGLICLPTLYYFSVLFGSRLRFLQMTTLILTSQAVTAVLALGVTPISLLFLLSGTDANLLVLLNIGALGLCAVLGLIFLVQGMLYANESQPPERMTFGRWFNLFVRGGVRTLVLIGWLLLYGLIGAQLSYALRPFFGVPLEGRDFFSSVGNAALSQLTFQQTTTLMMAAVTITGALSLAFASISLFFWLTIGEQYTILILLNVIILGISSWWGLSFLRQGMRHVQRHALDVRQWRILTTWLVIYAFVGTQMAWALRPFFGVPSEPFVILRSDGGTFIGSMFTALGWLARKLFGY